MAESLEREIEGLRSLFRSERDPEGRAFVPLADAYRRNQDLERALQLVNEGLERHPDFASAHVVSAWIHRDLGDRDTARDAWARVLELDEENVEALRGMGTLLLESGRMEEARPYLEKARSLDPEDPDVQGYLAGVEPAPAAAATLSPGAVVSGAEWPPVAEEGAPDPDDADSDADEPALAFARSLAAAGADVGAGAPPPPEETSLSADEPASALEESAVESLESANLSQAEPPHEATVADEAPAMEPVLEPWMGGLERVGFAADLTEGTDEVEVLEETIVVAAGAEALIRSSEITEVWSDRGQEDEEEEGPALLPATRTMAELFARQGLTARAVEIYERLVAENPGDLGLRERLEDLRAGLRPPAAARRTGGVHDDDTEAMAQGWGAMDDEPAASPFGWTPQESSVEEMEKAGEPISSYFSHLLAWEPPTGEEEASGVAAVAEPKESPAEPEPEVVAAVAVAEVFSVAIEGPPTEAAPWESAPTAPPFTPEQPDLDVVPIAALAPDHPAGAAAPAVVVPIASLAPDAVPIESLAPDDEPPYHGSTIQF